MVEKGTQVKMSLFDFSTGVDTEMRVTFTHDFEVVPGTAFSAKIEAVKTQPTWETVDEVHA